MISLKSSFTRASMLFLCLAISLCGLASPETASAQDIGSPDSAYFIAPEFRLLSCPQKVECRLKLRLFCDCWATGSYYSCKIQVSSNAYVDSGIIHPHSSTRCEVPTFWKFRYDSTNQYELAVGCEEPIGSILPIDSIAFEYLILADPGDTITIGLASPWDMQFTWPIEPWIPTYCDLNRTIVIPDSFSVSPGDVNSSGQVSISDAVFLISYVFAGGCAPYDLNAADVSGNCAVSISDAVYLINYIFAGGNAPVQGCVVP